MAEVIEGQQSIEEHQLGVRHGQVVFGEVADIFQLANHIVSEVSNGSRGKRRQARHRGGTMFPQEVLHHLKDVVGQDLAAAAAGDFDLPAPSFDQHVRADAKEGVASDLLSAFDRFQ